MHIAPVSGAKIDLAALAPKVEGGILAVWAGAAESDGFNQLTLAAGLVWSDVTILRALSRYLRQIGISFSQSLSRDGADQAPRCRDGARCDVPRAARSGLHRRARAGERGRPRRSSRRALDRDHLDRRRPHRAAAAQPRRCQPAHQRLSARRPRTRAARRSRSSSTAPRSTACPSRSPIARSSSIRRGSRACTCASGRSRAAASAGPTGRRISAPRCWASSRRSRSRTRSSCRWAPRARSCRS